MAQVGYHLGEHSINVFLAGSVRRLLLAEYSALEKASVDDGER